MCWQVSTISILKSVRINKLGWVDFGCRSRCLVPPCIKMRGSEQMTRLKRKFPDSWFCIFVQGENLLVRLEKLDSADENDSLMAD